VELHRGNATPTARGREGWFQGVVWIDRIVQAPAPARVRAYRVAFEPGARTAWHAHPLGQTLHGVWGLGLVQSRGGTPRLIRPGDAAWIPPGEEHWHGAVPDAAMVHLAIHEAGEDGSETAWLEQVTDADHRAAAAGAS